MFRTHAVSPAYNRDYKTASEARAAWDEGKDFIHECGPHCPNSGGMYLNKADVDQFAPNDGVEVHFNSLTRSVVVKEEKDV